MSNNGSPKNIKIHYIKTNSYRTYHADGFFGGVTPSGKLYIEPYIDRGPTPKSIDFKLSPDGKLGDEVTRESKDGLIREIETGIICDVQVAESLIVWLQQKIKEFKDKTKNSR